MLYPAHSLFGDIGIEVLWRKQPHNIKFDQARDIMEQAR